MRRSDEKSLDLILFARPGPRTAGSPTPVTDDQLRGDLPDIMRVGADERQLLPGADPVRAHAGGEARLLPALSPGNVDKTKAAPVTAIIGYDTRFFELAAEALPHRPEMKNPYEANADARRDRARSATARCRAPTS